MNLTDYQPAPAALTALHNVDLVALVGPSGAGKTTLMQAAIAQMSSLHVVLNDTSRPPRPHEQDGMDYFFRTRQAMLDRMARGEYSQVAPRMTDDFYATAPEAFVTGGVGIMAVWADAVPQFRALPFRSLRTVFITPPSYAVWQRRLAGERNALTKRLAEARRSLQFALEDDATTCLLNEDLSTATDVLVRIASAQPLTETMLADQRRVKAVIRELLRQLDR